MNREEFVSHNRIEAVLASRGVLLVPAKEQQDVQCLFHQDGSASMSINTTKQLWHCKAGCGGGSVIDLLAKIENTTPLDILRRASVVGNGHTKEKPKEREWKTICTYDYNDELGGLLYQVVRMHADDRESPKGYIKTFRQRQPDNANGWKWTMDGATRVLYRLVDVVKASRVWIVEGEKDCDALVKLGFCATCNVGGAGKWLDSYSDTLKGKDVVICGDNDDPGEKHVKQVFESIAGKARTVRVVKLHGTVKDVSDFISTFKDETDSKRALESISENCAPFTKGVRLPIYRMFEIEARYQRLVQNIDQCALNFGRWIPELGRQVRHLLPGEVAVFIADTGVGKTACLQNIALKAAKPMPTLMFELELPAELMYERFVAIQTKMTCAQVEAAYKSGETLGEQALEKQFAHVFVCAESRLSISDITDYINHAELKIGERPRIVLIDYIGLVKSEGGSRYERISRIAEELKVIAKATQTVLVCASQVHRSEDDNSPPGLHDAKDSGSIENSAGLVVGVWKDKDDRNTMYMKVLKNTKGRPGDPITCNFDGERCIITERAKTSDVPMRT